MRCSYKNKVGFLNSALPPGKMKITAIDAMIMSIPLMYSKKQALIQVPVFTKRIS
jgi:hypothetical protein